MSAINQRLLILVLLGGLSVAVLFAISRVSSLLGLDILAFHEALSRYEQENQRRDQLANEAQMIQQNLADRNQVVADLLSSRITLWDAAARFKALNEQCPKFSWIQFTSSHPGRTEEERHSHQVLTSVRERLGLSPNQYHAALAKLEKEFREVQRKAQILENGQNGAQP
jgi:chorismate mutase